MDGKGEEKKGREREERVREKTKRARGAKLYEREIELFNLGNNCARQVIEAAFEANVVGISNMEKDVDMQGNQT